MGGKLSKKKKGYDVSESKDKKEEAPNFDGGPAESAKVEDGATPTEAKMAPGGDTAVENITEATAAAQVTEAAAPLDESKSAPQETKEQPTPEKDKSVVPAEEPAEESEKENVVISVAAIKVSEELVKPPEEKFPEVIQKDPKASPTEEPASVATKEVVLEQKSTMVEAAPVEVSAAVSQEPEEPPESAEETAQVEQESAVLPEDQGTENQKPPKLLKEESSAPASEEPVQIETKIQDWHVVKEPSAAVESSPETEVSISGDPKPVQETEQELSVEENLLPHAVPELQTKSEPALELEPKAEETQEEKAEQQSAVNPSQPDAEPVETLESEPESEQKIGPKQSQEPETQQMGEQEPVQELDAEQFVTVETIKEPELQPPVAISHALDPETAGEHPTDVIEAGVNESNPAAAKESASGSDVAEPVPEIVISQSVSACDVSAETGKAAEAFSDEPEVKNKMENGDLGSSSAPENEVDGVPAVNGDSSRDSGTTQEEECFNSNKNLEETPTEEKTDYELKKDMNLCGDISNIVEGHSNEVTQAV